MPSATVVGAEEARRKDYSLVGREAALAVDRGLAEADWYTSPVPRDVMRELLERRDGPAIRDTILYFALIGVSGYLTWRLWGSWWAVLPMMVYGVLYASASDARWHEAGHGTAFRTDWLNNALYEVASFMVLRESVPWRWSHARHHSDTIIVGRDPEIAVPRPPDIPGIVLKAFNHKAWRRYVTNIALHCVGRVTPDEATFIPPSEYPKVFLRARIYAAIQLTILGLCVWYGTWLPLVFVLGPNLYAAWMMTVYGLTQHAALAENVLDHRLNCRTIRMNAVHRFLYWNMNYHTEHHMFPMVPYHQLPRLHAVVKDDCPEPYRASLPPIARSFPRCSGRCENRAGTCAASYRLPRVPSARARRPPPSRRRSPAMAGSTCVRAPRSALKTWCAWTTMDTRTLSTAPLTVACTPPTARVRTATRTWPTVSCSAPPSSVRNTTAASTSSAASRDVCQCASRCGRIRCARKVAASCSTRRELAALMRQPTLSSSV